MAMTHEALPPDDAPDGPERSEAEPYFRPEDPQLTLNLSDGETTRQFHLNYDNTTIRLFYESPEANCIEVRLPDPEDPDDSYHVVRIFERNDLIEALSALRFPVYTERYIDPEIVDQLAAAEAASVETEWSLADDQQEELAHSLGIVGEMTPHTSPIVDIEFPDGTVFKANYDNTHVVEIVSQPDMSYVRFDFDIEEAGNHRLITLFSQPETIDDLKQKNFPLIRRPYPLPEELDTYLAWVHKSMDYCLDTLLGRGPEDGGLTGSAA